MKIKYQGKGGKRSIRTCEYCGEQFETLDISIRAKGERFCSIECYQSFRRDNKMDERERNIIHQKKHKYGLSEEQYKQMFIDQNNSCKICGITFGETKGEKAHVDHCHTTKKVRGLLCTKCNSLLGMAKDDINILQKAIKYLSE